MSPGNWSTALGLALLYAICSFVYAEILIAPGMLLEKWPGVLKRLTGHRPWLYNPLVGCSFCVAGQMAFWTYPLVAEAYAFLPHLLTICSAILIVAVFKRAGLGLARPEGLGGPKTGR